METIQAFIHGGMLVLEETTTANVAARAMEERKVGSVVCMKEGKVTGILTDRDLATQIVAFRLSVDTPISEVMTPEIQCVNEYASLADVVNIMETYGVRRVPVVQKINHNREKCVGMVTLDDLLISQAISLE